MARLILQTALNSTITGETDEGAVLAGAAGAASFEDLVALHEPRVRRLAYRLLGWHGNGADVDDIVQDVFLVLLKKFDSFRGDSSLSTWLTRVTINRCRTHQRRRWLKLNLLRRHRPARLSEEAPASDHGALRDETGAKVRAAVQKLKREDREMIVLFYLEELPSAVIANLLGISVGAVDVRLHRARKRLKGALSDLMSE